MIQPTRPGARGFGLSVHDPERIAAALPIRAVTPQSNLGDAHIRQLAVSDALSLPLSANGGDIVLTFDADALCPRPFLQHR